MESWISLLSRRPLEPRHRHDHGAVRQVLKVLLGDRPADAARAVLLVRLPRVDAAAHHHPTARVAPDAPTDARQRPAVLDGAQPVPREERARPGGVGGERVG